MTQINQLAGDAVLQRRQPAQRRQSDDRLQPDRHELADHHRRELQRSGSRPATIAQRQRVSRTTTRSATAVTAINSRDLDTCKPRPRRSAPIRASSATRQTFETNMINTLQTGASNLVAADQNQESADLLDRANPAAAGNLRTVHRQPGEPVGAQAVRLNPSGAGLTVKAAGRKPRRFPFGAWRFVMSCLPGVIAVAQRRRAAVSRLLTRIRNHGSA